ncbi:MAG: helix-turn-helix transcriptional regulator [Betaproteobacteria bacterium]
MKTTNDLDSIETLGDCLLSLGRLARNLPVAEFLLQGVKLAVKTIDCRSVWWGLVFQAKSGKVHEILQADSIGLPESLVNDWRRIATIDPFVQEMTQCLGQVKRALIDDVRFKSVPVLTEFAQRYGIRNVMGMCLDEEATGQSFFMVMYRGDEGPSFSDHDAMLFRHVMKHLVQLWYFSLQNELGRNSIEPILRVALSRLDGQLLYAGPEFCEVIQRKWPQWDGITLPAAVVEHFSRLPCTIRLPSGSIDLFAHGDQVQLSAARQGDTAQKLSPREQRVAYLFASGLTYKEIARQLLLSPTTVRTYLRNAYIHLGVNNKVQLSNSLQTKFSN